MTLKRFIQSVPGMALAMPPRTITDLTGAWENCSDPEWMMTLYERLRGDRLLLVQAMALVCERTGRAATEAVEAARNWDGTSNRHHVATVIQAYADVVLVHPSIVAAAVREVITIDEVLTVAIAWGYVPSEREAKEVMA